MTGQYKAESQAAIKVQTVIVTLKAVLLIKMK